MRSGRNSFEQSSNTYNRLFASDGSWSGRPGSGGETVCRLLHAGDGREGWSERGGRTLRGGGFRLANSRTL